MKMGARERLGQAMSLAAWAIFIPRKDRSGLLRFGPCGYYIGWSGHVGDSL